jgi:sulfur carrier protein ThiS
VKRLILLCLGIAALGACDKNSKPAPAPTTRTDILTAKSWRLATAIITVNGIPVPSSLVLPACNNDDSFKFNVDKTLIQDAGAIKCNSTDPQTQAGTWTFNTDQSKLTIAIPGSPLNGEADIKELTTSTLHIHGTPTISGVAATVDATFVPN